MDLDSSRPLRLSRPRPWAFTAVYLLFTFSSWIVGAFLPVYLRDLGLGDALVGSLISVQTLAALLAILPLGLLSDRISPRPLVAVAMLLQGTFLAGLAATRRPVLVAAALALGGFTSSLFLISFNSLFLKTLPPGGNDRARRYAVFLAGTLLGFSLGPVVGGFLYKTGAIAPLAKVALGATVCGLALTFWLPVSPPTPVRVWEYMQDARRPEVLFLVAFVAILASHNGVETVCLPLLIQRTLGRSPQELGGVFALVGIWIIVLQQLIGRRVDARGRSVGYVSVGLAISGLFQAATGLSSGLVSVIVFRLLHTVGDAFTILFAEMLVSIIFPKARSGGSYAFVHGLRTATVSLFAFLAGLSNAAGGYRLSFFWSGGLLVLAAAVLLGAHGRLRSILRPDEP